MTDETKRIIADLKCGCNKQDCWQCGIPCDVDRDHCTIGDAAEIIESLVEKLDRAEREKNEAWNVVERLNKQIELMAGALERVKQERDAAIADISRQCNKCKNFKIMFNGCTLDYDCKYSDVCKDGNHWEWRGHTTCS